MVVLTVHSVASFFCIRSASVGFAFAIVGGGFGFVVTSVGFALDSSGFASTTLGSTTAPIGVVAAGGGFGVHVSYASVCVLPLTVSPSRRARYLEVEEFSKGGEVRCLCWPWQRQCCNRGWYSGWYPGWYIGVYFGWYLCWSVGWYICWYRCECLLRHRHLEFRRRIGARLAGIRFQWCFSWCSFTLACEALATDTAASTSASRWWLTPLAYDTCNFSETECPCFEMECFPRSSVCLGFDSFSLAFEALLSVSLLCSATRWLCNARVLVMAPFAISGVALPEACCACC